MTDSNLLPAGVAQGLAPDDDNCYTAIGQAVADQPGIVNIHLDPDNELLSIDYDPEVLSDPDVVRITGRVAPVVSVVLWSLNDLWQPWSVLTFLVAFLPIGLIVQWKQNAYLSVLAHTLANVLIAVALVGASMRLAP